MKRGVEDRWKIINVLMLMTFAKDVAPYALMYNPGMLPSTFSSRWYVGKGEERGSDDVNSGYVRELVEMDRKRAHAVIDTLNRIEHDCVNAGFVEALNPFGKNKVKRRMEGMKEVAGVVRTAMSLDPDRVCEDFLEGFCFRDGYGEGKKGGKGIER